MSPYPRRILELLAVACCLALVPSQVAAAGQTSGRAIVGAIDGAGLAAAANLTVLRTTSAADHDALLVKLNNGQSVSNLRQALQNYPNVLSVEAAETVWLQAAKLAEADVSVQDQVAEVAAPMGTMTTPCVSQYFAEDPWAGWVNQYATVRVAIGDAQAAAGHCGEGVIVAVIDTGVDADHPLLQGAVLPGFDFLEGVPATSAEWSSLDTSMRAIVETSMRAIVETSMRAIVETSMRAIVEMDSMAVVLANEDVQTLEDLDLPPLFGHGTMVAGIVRLVAPGAKILPLRAFDGNGEGTSFDIVRAVYYAVDQGADVINMSFSMEALSPELSKALRYARSHGVVTVVAAGNQGERQVSYPASDAAAVGVAASDMDDHLAGFSNLGVQVADLAAPGVAVLSAFPGGHYAAGWGTSFSTPFVAGAAALLRFGMPDDQTTRRDTVDDLLLGVTQVDDLQSLVLTGGRLDVHGAILESFDD